MNAKMKIPEGVTVLVDTNPIIYLFENNPLASRFSFVFEAVENGYIQALVTPITLSEVVSGPLKNGNEALAEKYRQVLTNSAGWKLREIDGDIAVLAARIRLQHRLKLPDAIQLATALHEGCYALVSHDRDFKDIQNIRIFS